MDNTTFLATWGDNTHNIGMINLTMAELKEFTRITGSDKGELITLMFIYLFFIGIMRTVRSQSRNTNENTRRCAQFETEV